MQNPRGRRPSVPATAVRQVVYEEFEPSSAWTHDSAGDVLLVDLPGFKKEEVKLQVDNLGKITVSGERRLDERKFRRFKQVFNCPEGSDVQKVSGKFEHGLLFVIIPKKQVEQREEPQKGSTSTETTKLDRRVAEVPEQKGKEIDQQGLAKVKESETEEERLGGSEREDSKRDEQKGKEKQELDKREEKKGEVKQDEGRRKEAKDEMKLQEGKREVKKDEVKQDEGGRKETKDELKQQEGKGEEKMDEVKQDEGQREEKRDGVKQGEDERKEQREEVRPVEGKKEVEKNGVREDPIADTEERRKKEVKKSGVGEEESHKTEVVKRDEGEREERRRGLGAQQRWRWKVDWNKKKWWLETDFAENMMEMARENKVLIATALAAFSLGVLVSRRLRSG